MYRLEVGVAFFTMDHRQPPNTLSEYLVQDSFHSYLKSSLAQAKVEKLIDVDLLASAEGDLMITGALAIIQQTST